MFLVFQLLHPLCLECLHTFHLDKWLLCIHMLCINKGFPILCHHMLLHLILGIFTRYLQWVPSNSGRTNRSWQMKALLLFLLLWISITMVIINNVFLIDLLVFRLHQKVHRYLRRMNFHHPKLIKTYWDQMQTTIMKFLLMDKVYVKTIWMFKTAKGQCLIPESRHPLWKQHRSCE